MLSADEWAYFVGMVVGCVIMALGVISLIVGAWVVGAVFFAIGGVCWAVTIRAMIDAADL